jgi:hypothetical protein
MKFHLYSWTMFTYSVLQRFILGELRSSLLFHGIPDDVTVLNLCIGIRIQFRAVYISR